jgi:asparagine synthase (glutamine-hydrolysing)
LLPLYHKHGLAHLLSLIDGEFAFVLVDEKNESYLAARDPMGIRPLFYGRTKANGAIAFASEAKALQGLCNEIKPFPPGYYYQDVLLFAIKI